MPALVGIFVIVLTIIIVKSINKHKYMELESEVLRELNISSWNIVPYIDENIIVKSRQALEQYDDIKFFKGNKENLNRVKNILKRKNEISITLSNFLTDNNYKNRYMYRKLKNQITTIIENAKAYRICVTYISYAGNNLGSKIVIVTQYDLIKFDKDPFLLMGKAEYNSYLREQEREAVAKKQHEYYELVNQIIDHANDNRSLLFVKGSVEQLDVCVARLFDRTVNSIKKIKNINSEEWCIVKKFIKEIDAEIRAIISKNEKVLRYYDSADFLKIKETCEVLMCTQREFNEYITDKVESISNLFGTRIYRNETINDDVYQYLRPYKKTITPFTVELSANVFASAENNPLEYVIKNFYPNRNTYPEQIQRLHLLLEELATLKEAKQIIDNYKKEYQQYLKNVPQYVIRDDEAGFYTRLGFANIDENALTVEYTFSYTSGGGFAKRQFTVPMTEETISELINAMEAKLTISVFTKEQRALMTTKLRDFIKQRDNFTCCHCGNSVHNEPNLLLEIDHIVPVSRGGYTLEENLQTLCWKCNRAKSNKIAN